MNTEYSARHVLKTGRIRIQPKWPRFSTPGVEPDRTAGPGLCDQIFFFFGLTIQASTCIGGFKLNYFTQRIQQRTLQRCFNSIPHLGVDSCECPSENN